MDRVPFPFVFTSLAHWNEDQHQRDIPPMEFANLKKTNICEEMPKSFHLGEQWQTPCAQRACPSKVYWVIAALSR